MRQVMKEKAIKAFIELIKNYLESKIWNLNELRKGINSKLNPQDKLNSDQITSIIIRHQKEYYIFKNISRSGITRYIFVKK